MNILYCIPHLYNAGGMERVLTQKVNWLVAHTDHQVGVYCDHGADSGREADLLLCLRRAGTGDGVEHGF